MTADVIIETEKSIQDSIGLLEIQEADAVQGDGSNFVKQEKAFQVPVSDREKT